MKEFDPDKFGKAKEQLFIEICKALRVDKLCDWLSDVNYGGFRRLLFFYILFAITVLIIIADVFL